MDLSSPIFLGIILALLVAVIIYFGFIKHSTSSSSFKENVPNGLKCSDNVCHV
jgi:cell division protein FtsN